ncbi:DUF1013 domain-containing protein, partial [Rhizobium ruizarguesonis]
MRLYSVIFPGHCGDNPRTATGADDRMTISMSQTLLMPKATAILLVDNTALSFERMQFAELRDLIERQC